MPFGDAEMGMERRGEGMDLGNEVGIREGNAVGGVDEGWVGGEPVWEEGNGVRSDG